MSDSWPSVLSKTVPSSPISDYSGELTAPNLKSLTALGQKMHYKAHVVVMPRTAEIASADKLAAMIAQKWQLGPDHLVLLVDLRNGSLGTSMGALLAKKGINAGQLEQVFWQGHAQHSFKRGELALPISRVMHSVEHRYAKDLAANLAGKTASGQASHSSSGLGSLGGFFLGAVIFLVIFGRVIHSLRSSYDTRRMSLRSRRDPAIGEDVDSIKSFIEQPHEQVQVPMKEFAKRVHVKNPQSEADADSQGENPSLLPAPNDGQVLVDGARTRTSEGQMSLHADPGPFSDRQEESQAEGDPLPVPVEAKSPAESDLAAPVPVEPVWPAERELAAPVPAEAKSPAERASEFLAAAGMVAEHRKPGPELEREFQKELGDYGDLMVSGDTDAPATAAGLASSQAAVTPASISAVSPPDFSAEPAKPLPPSLPASGWSLPPAVSPGAPVSPVPVPAPAPQSSFDFHFDGGFTDFSKPAKLSQGAEAPAGAGPNQSQSLCPQCGAQKSVDFAFCLKCGHMFV